MPSVARALPLLANVGDFLAWVESQPERYELVGGRVVMMAGGSATHNDIQVNLLAALRRRLRAPCRPNGPDLLIRIDDRTGRFPDASVSCGARGRDFVADPVVVFEILSPTTEAEDRGAKRRDYQRLAALRHYVLLAQDAVRAELYTRAETGWLLIEYEAATAVLPLDAAGIALPLAEIYEDVELAVPEGVGLAR